MSALDYSALWQMLLPIVLALPRVGAVFVVAPLLMRGAMPSMVRNGLALSFSLCAYPFMAAQLPLHHPGFFGWFALVAKEVLIGGMIGYAAGVLVWVLEGVGSLIDVQSGLSNAMLFEPFGGHESGLFSSFMGMLGGALFLACGGLYVLLTLLLDSYRFWPPGAFEPELGGLFLQQGLHGIAQVNEYLVRLAVPAVLVLVLLEVGIGMLGRVVPQLNVFFFSVPIKCTLAALMLALSLSYLVDFGRGYLASLQGLLQPLGRALGVAQD